MSSFPIKKFQGHVYTFNHLNRETRELEYVVNGVIKKVVIVITFGLHCFTEEFNSDIHNDEHRYKHKGETRAFNIGRFECSKHLPLALDALMDGLVYRSDHNYTYVMQIQIPTNTGVVPYSMFFSLSNIRGSNRTNSDKVVLDLYVKSAYLTPLKSRKNAENARFKKIAGKVAGFF